MEASCFVTSKSFGKTLDLAPPLRTWPLISHSRRRPTHGCSFRQGGGSPSSLTILCRSLRSSSSPDDGREPALESDWRSFRARLVAAERATARPEGHAAGSLPAPGGVDQIQNPAQVTLGDKWAHSLHEPERGCLLIATEKLDGVHIFERAVILLVSAGPAGPTGVILNRPSLMSIKETRSVALDVAGTFSDRPLFFGGPLEEGLFLVSPPEGKVEGVARSGVFDEVMKGMYYGTKESVGCAAEMVKRDVVGVGDFRFFDGYCEWEEEQLRDEIRAGYWTVAACSASVIGMASAGNGSSWEKILGLVGERKVR